MKLCERGTFSQLKVYEKVYKRVRGMRSLKESKEEQLLFMFLWKGTDKVTRVSVINDYEKGGLKMIDTCMESMVMAWLKLLFNDSNATWKMYLLHLF